MAETVTKPLRQPLSYQTVNGSVRFCRQAGRLMIKVSVDEAQVAHLILAPEPMAAADAGVDPIAAAERLFSVLAKGSVAAGAASDLAQSTQPSPTSR